MNSETLLYILARGAQLSPSGAAPAVGWERAALVGYHVSCHVGCYVCRSIECGLQY